MSTRGKPVSDRPVWEEYALHPAEMTLSDGQVFGGCGLPYYEYPLYVTFQHPACGSTMRMDSWPDYIARTQKSKMSEQWSELYGGTYDFPIDKLKAEGKIYRKPVWTNLMPTMPDDVKIIQQSVGDVVMTNTWKMFYTAVETEFSALWQDTKDKAEALGVQSVIERAVLTISDAQAIAKKYGF